MAITETDGVRCSAWAREVTLQPTGTAAVAAGFVVVDWPLPWPQDLGMITQLAQVAARGKETGLRLQGRVPVENSRRLTLYRQVEGVAGLVADEVPYPEADPVAALEEALRHPAGTFPLQAHRGELLVCSHGARDVCCGGPGTRLALFLDDGEPGEVSGPGGRRVGRTSHTGGHRFAPTVLLLPEATVWAYVDEQVAQAITRRGGDVAELAHHYRGCTTLPSREAQVVEAGIFAELGWELFAHPRTAVQVGEDTWQVSLGPLAGPSAGSDPGSAAEALGAGPDRPAGEVRRIWEGKVGRGRTVPIPDCGGTVADAYKSETELELVSLTRIS